MSKLKLHLEHNVEADVRSEQGDRYVAVYLANDHAYCTYSVDPEGNCYWGHYMLKTIGAAVRDLVKRSGIPLVAFPPELRGEAGDRRELNNYGYNWYSAPGDSDVGYITFPDPRGYCPHDQWLMPLAEVYNRRYK